MRELLAELRRRKVIRVAAMYLVGAWATIEVVDTIAPNLGLPDWTATLVIVLAAVGLPLALVLSWAYDLTPGGLVADPGAPHDRAGGAEAGAPGIRDGAAADPRDEGRPATEAARPAVADRAHIAVLPFVNMSSDPDNEYFSDGMTEELVNALANVDGLRVASRTSAFAFKMPTQPL